MNMCRKSKTVALGAFLLVIAAPPVLANQHGGGGGSQGEGKYYAEQRRHEACNADVKSAVTAYGNQSATAQAEIERLRTAKANIEFAFERMRAAALGMTDGLEAQLPPFPAFAAAPAHPQLGGHLAGNRCTAHEAAPYSQARSRFDNLVSEKSKQEVIIDQLKLTYDNFLAAISS
jgi:hypothetical protein